MPKKVPLQSVGVNRDGTTVYPTVGKPFDFTKEELANMDKLKEGDGLEYYRELKNEAVVDTKADHTDSKPASNKLTDLGKNTGGKKADGDL